MNTQQLVLGISIIAAGVVAFLSNIDAGSTRAIVADWWPLAIVALGIYMFWSNSRNVVWATTVVLGGLLVLFKTLDVVDINVGQIIFPLLLVAAGLSLIMGARHRTNHAVSKDQENITAILGGVANKNTSRDYTGGMVNAFMGGAEIDLSDATIKSEATLQLSIFMGGLELRVPKNVIVKSRTACILGGTEDKTNPIEGKNSPVLYLEGTVFMGGVEVKR